MAYIRLAPSDPARWHIDLVNDRPTEMRFTLLPPGDDLVMAERSFAWVDAYATSHEAGQMLARLADVAAETPRTTLLAGSVADGHITWITRSLVFGFPDYTTAQITPSGLTIYARERFGRYDFGVNAARLRDWTAKLSP